jgi:asparagine synthase (glutamine-hydrolysing)
MAGIAGIAVKGAGDKVAGMLGRMRHRGKTGIAVFENEGTTLGIVWNDAEIETVKYYLAAGNVGYDIGPGHYARVTPEKGKFILCRDELGVAPLYYGRDLTGNLCFASEIKALMMVTNEIKEMSSGHFFDGTALRSFFSLKAGIHSEENPDRLAQQLRYHLDQAVRTRIKSDNMGSWLSGGLDSSAICTIAAGHLRKLDTFATGIKDAPDLEFAREVAGFIKSRHHETILTLDDLLSALPEVIYHLESFDALLVRSSITNFFVAKLASDHVQEVFSGEGGDELFGGYDYLKSIPVEQLEDELVKITRTLHNTALQRVDRCASAHGTIAHVIFTDPEVVKFAFTIPAKYKIYNNIEKWILRKALEGSLPERVLMRPKMKFWEGAGIKELISGYADKIISDSEFMHERNIHGGFIVNTKEELHYYRIFRDHFGSEIDLSFMGRTSGSRVV